LYVKADSKLKINNLNDAKRAGLIGVYRGDARDQILTQLGFDNLDRANSTIFSFRKLMIGRVAMYADAPLALKSLAESEGYKSSDVRLAYTFYRAQLYIATSKETDPAIVAQWNKALEQMKKESVFQNIYRNNYPNIDPPGPTITKFE
jgi:polar amino acid transport system substrate-binding protein